MSLNQLSRLLFHYFRARYGRRFSDRQALENWQHKQIQHFIKNILPHSPFYRPYLTQAFEQGPIMNKSLMMKHFDELNTVGITQAAAFKIALQAEQSRDFSPMIQNITVGLSSGTSGNRGLFLVSPAERMKWAGSILAKALPGSIFEPHKIAFFLRANSNLYTSVRSRRIQFKFLDLLKDLETHIKQLNEYQPTILIAPAQVLRLLATAQLEKRLQIQAQKIISVAEVLERSDENLIQAAFKQITHQVYQCTEGFLGITCRYGTVHLNEDFVFFEKEWIDKNSRRFVPIITDFSRMTQPIVRYRLDDVLQEKAQPCPCGSVFKALARIEGRCDDIFYIPSKENGTLKPVFSDFIRRAIMQASPDILEYQVIQHTPHQLEVAVSSQDNSDLENQIIGSFKQLFNEMACVAPAIRFSQGGKLALDKKRRRVERIKS